MFQLGEIANERRQVVERIGLVEILGAEHFEQWFECFICRLVVVVVVIAEIKILSNGFAILFAPRQIRQDGTGGVGEFVRLVTYRLDEQIDQVRHLSQQMFGIELVRGQVDQGQKRVLADRFLLVWLERQCDHVLQHVLVWDEQHSGLKVTGEGQHMMNGKRLHVKSLMRSYEIAQFIDSFHFEFFEFILWKKTLIV